MGPHLKIWPIVSGFAFLITEKASVQAFPSVLSRAFRLNHGLNNKLIHVEFIASFGNCKQNLDCNKKLP